MDIINTYADFFNDITAEDSGPIIDPLPILIPFADQVDGMDAGMEVEGTMSPEQLGSNLGFKEGLPLLFNTHRHKGGLTAWDEYPPNTFDVDGPLADDLEQLRLHWHQLAAIHSMMRKNFLEDRSEDRPPGILVADEVGLGKTFQAAAMIAFMTDVVTRQEAGYPLPPLIGMFEVIWGSGCWLMLSQATRPFLGNNETVPDHPHLILVPGTLVAQWVHELKVVLKPYSFDIFTYGSGRDTHEAFFAESGPFNTSRFTANRIIVASHSVCQLCYYGVIFVS